MTLPATETLTLTYSSGRVQTVADGTGNTWTYTYTAGQLTSVAGPGGRTTLYGYASGTPEKINALQWITRPDGAQQNFTYDLATCRLSGTSQNGEEAITYAYPNEGEVVATNGLNQSTTTWFNEMGLPARIENGSGAISNFFYDANGNLVGYLDAAGHAYQYKYDVNGNLTQVINPLGQVVSMTYGALSKLTSLTDAAGNTTQYGYSAAGNLLNITYPGGSQQSLNYDPLGNLSETVLQNGHAIDYQYNAAGKSPGKPSPTSPTRPSSTMRGNLTQAQTFDLRRHPDRHDHAAI